MLNEILKGQARVTATSSSDSPYRTESVPDESRTCMDCKQPFQTKVTSRNVRCALCHVKFVETNAAISASAYAAAEASQAGSRRSAAILRIGLVVVCSIGIGLFRMGMRDQFDEDMATASGTHYQSPSRESPPLLESLRAVVNDACECTDMRCINAYSDTIEAADLLHTAATNAELARFRTCSIRVQSQ